MPSPGRKFAITLLVIALSTIALAFGWIRGGTWADVVVWVTGIYMGGNVLHYAAGRVRIEPKG